MSFELETVTDEELARQTRAGSHAAFEKLVFRYEERVYQFVAKSCRSAADALEITQDTFVRAFQGMERFDVERNFAAWLFTIARRRCIDHFRAQPPLADAAMPELTDGDDPAAAMARREDGQGVWALARRELSAAQFEVLWLKYAEDMSVEQIAQVVRKTKTHVKVMLFRARESLGEKLQQAARDEARPKPRETDGVEKKSTPAMRAGGGEPSNRVGTVVM
jgi:RNA polymerase sigma-70 factor (ECF subfamily)